MGYAYYVLSDGREAGYNVPATCDEPGCNAEIDRGLAYLCGEMPGGGDDCCGDYFCYAHLNWNQRCDRCYGLKEAKREAEIVADNT